MSDITIPTPLVAPFGVELNKPEYVQEVWDAFVKPHQDSRMPPSTEMRMLMAILRAVYKGLEETEL
jgi:hypothetical protein